MSKLAIATCVLGLIALATTAQAVSPCLELLAEKITAISVPEPILEFSDWLDKKIERDDQDRWVKEYLDEYDDAPQYPRKVCRSYDAEIMPIIEEFMDAREDCSLEVFASIFGASEDHFDSSTIERFGETCKAARANAILAPRLKALNACDDFKPYRTCSQALSDDLSEIKVPKPLSDYVAMLESAKMPFDEHFGWSWYSNDERELYMEKYPLKSCNSYDRLMRSVFDSPTLCPGQLANSYIVRENEKAASIMKAYRACLAFEPTTPGMGRWI